MEDAFVSPTIGSLHRIGVLALALAATFAAPAGAQAAGFSAGAGRVVTTPPRAGTPEAAAADAAFAPEFANCPADLFPDRGRFALQEPFQDVNANGQWDDVPLDAPPQAPPEPFCDANGNGRWDGLYDSGKVDAPLLDVHDDIEARAFAIAGDGGKPVVTVSVVQQGLFENYTDLMRARLKDVYGVDADMVVSANHNESSPDSVGIYGPFVNPAVDVGSRSGIDEYFMRWLEDRVAHVAADAVHAMQPATLHARQIPLPDRITLGYSDQFPTFDTRPDPTVPAAIDPKIGILQARNVAGDPIFTVLSFAAHNQEVGHSKMPAVMSSDWPGVFARTFDSRHPGVALFLAGDNGSQEDPVTNPPVVAKTGEGDQFTQTQATGEAFASVVEDAVGGAVPLAAGPVALHRQEFCVPLENNGFLALYHAGIFGQRSAYACDPSTGEPVSPSPSGRDLRTYVSYTDVGPDMQLLAHPGEGFPALLVGSPFGVDETSCDRPNPAVPTWNARAPFRFQVGLADDMIGYLIPAWGFWDPTPGLFQTDCQGDGSDRDRAGQKHKLESESVGFTGANSVADRLAGLLVNDADGIRTISKGRYVLADGKLSRWPLGAVGVVLPDAGKTEVGPATGRFLGYPGTQGAGGRAVDRSALPMDYDGQPQAGPDILTRGAESFDTSGCAAGRFYVNVFDALTQKDMGAVQTLSGVPGPNQNCRRADGTQDDTNHGKGDPNSPAGGGDGAGGPGSGPGGGTAGSCNDRIRPRATAAGKKRLRGRTLRMHGRASDLGCANRKGFVVRVTVTILRHAGKRCRFVAPDGRLTATRSCRRPIQLLANGTKKWSFRKRLRGPRGNYLVIVRAFDAAGNGQSTSARRGATRRILRVL